MAGKQHSCEENFVVVIVTLKIRIIKDSSLAICLLLSFAKRDVIHTVCIEPKLWKRKIIFIERIS